MLKLKFLVGAALFCAAITCNAQTYQVQPQPFGGGYNVYGPGYQLIQQIKPQPFERGYNIYDGQNRIQYQVQPQPFGNGYLIHTYGR